jgi:hypothetical protein
MLNQLMSYDFDMSEMCVKADDLQLSLKVLISSTDKCKWAV